MAKNKKIVWGRKPPAPVPSAGGRSFYQVLLDQTPCFGFKMYAIWEIPGRCRDVSRLNRFRDTFPALPSTHAIQKSEPLIW